jgi:signal transduction histidine kinase
MTRHVADPSPARDRRVTIAAKLGLVMGAMTVITALVATVLFVQLRQVTTTYDSILGSQVRAALQAREMQVEFKKQVQEWKDILLRGSAPADLATYTTQFHDESATVDQLGNALVTSAPDDATRDEVRRFLAEHATLNQNYEAALAPFVAAGAKDPTVPDRAVRGQDRPPTARIDGLIGRLEKAMADRVAAQNAGVARQQRVLAVVGVIALLFLLGTLAFVVAGIVRPIRALTTAAYEAAHRALPDAIGKIRHTPGDAPPELPAVEVRSRDELRDLADALSSMQNSAVSLAFDQHQAERAAADILVNLGRRNQSLLKRTLGYITELEGEESDPDVLARLFRLDHATTRIRRNAESMLVIAGAAQTRTWSRPVPVAEVARAALSEIEDYVRVDPHHIEDVALTGASVADVVHLIAELLENATHFSPPNSRVVVVGQRLPDGYRLRVVDGGVGMTATELAAANARITQAADERGDSPLLGLYVVGRLSARHGIAVELEPSAGVGITATITFPAALLVDMTPPVGLPETVTPSAAPDAPTAQHRVVPQIPPPGIPQPRSPQPAMALVGAAAVAPHADRGPDLRPNLGRNPGPDLSAASPARRRLPDLGTLPAMPEPRGRSWVVPPDAASAPSGTVTGWFHALDDPAPTDDRPAVPNGVATDRSGAPARPDDAPTGPGGIPRRVRGAQLPDLGDARNEQEFVAPDPDQVRRQLSALHLGVERAQAEQAERS